MWILVSILAACPAPKPGDSADPPDSADTGHSAAPGTTPEVCAQYLQCLGDAGDAALTDAEAAYAPGGACDDSLAEAARCAEECAAALHDAYLAHPHTPSCDDGSTLPSVLALGKDERWNFLGGEYDDRCGGEMHLTELNVDAEGEDAPTFTFRGSVVVDQGVDETTYRPVPIDCTLAATAFTCAQATLYGDPDFLIELELSGQFLDGYSRAEAEGTVWVTVFGKPCRSLTQLSGTPRGG